MTDYPKGGKPPKSFADTVRGLMGERGIKSAKLASPDDTLKSLFGLKDIRDNPLPEPDIEDYGQNASLLRAPSETLPEAKLRWDAEHGGDTDIHDYYPAYLSLRRPSQEQLEEIKKASRWVNPTDSDNACARCCKKRLVILIQRETAIMRRDKDIWHWHGIIGRMTAQIINEGAPLPLQGEPFENPLIDTPVYETKGPPTGESEVNRAIRPGFYRIRAIDGDKHSTYGYNKKAVRNGKETKSNKLRGMNLLGDGTPGIGDGGWSPLDGHRGIDIHEGMSAEFTQGCLLPAPGIKYNVGTSKGYSPFWDKGASRKQIDKLVELIEDFKKVSRGGLKKDEPQNCVTVCVRNPPKDVFKDAVILERKNPKIPGNWNSSKGKDMQVKIINESAYEIIIGGKSQTLPAEDDNGPKCAILGKDCRKPK